MASAIGTFMQKHMLKNKNIGVKKYLHLEFIAIVGVFLPIIYFFWRLDPQALEPINIFIFSLVVLFSIIANLFLFYSLKGDKITNLEPGKILEPLFIILLAIVFSFFFSQELFERNFKIIIPAIIAGLALIFSHIEKHHLKFNKFFIAMIISSFFFAIELVISKLILDFYSPMSFYFLRSLGVLIISLIIFKPTFGKINKKVKWELALIGVIWVAFRVSMYWGYQVLGIISTTLIMMLAPIFIYFIAYFYFKEKIKWKNFIAAMVIVGCIFYALLAG